MDEILSGATMYIWANAPIAPSPSASSFLTRVLVDSARGHLQPRKFDDEIARDPRGRLYLCASDRIGARCL